MTVFPCLGCCRISDRSEGEVIVCYPFHELTGLEESSEGVKNIMLRLRRAVKM